MEEWEGTIVNLGHCHRKRGEYAEAIKVRRECNLGNLSRYGVYSDSGMQHYETAIGFCPRRSSTYSALAFTYHLEGSLDLAIEYYHRALGLKSDDTFSR
jgi:anaphase-promoting complex subunit 6